MIVAAVDGGGTRLDKLPALIAQVLAPVDPLRRPDPFGLEDALEEVFTDLATDGPAELVQVRIQAAEEILERCMTCDVMYTYNVITLGDHALSELEQLGEPVLAHRTHCLLARAYCFHQVGAKEQNLALARVHVQSAEGLPGSAATPTAVAEAWIDVARATELVGGHGSDSDAGALYQKARNELEPGGPVGLLEVANRGTADEAAGRSIDADGDAESLEDELAGLAGTLLPRRMVPYADELGAFYLRRAYVGDGASARRWLQTAERSLYYHAGLVRTRARNQLNMGRYFTLVSVAEEEDLRYVRNKALMHLQTAADVADGRGDRDLLGECLVAGAQLWTDLGDLELAESFLVQGLELPGLATEIESSLWEAYARLTAQTDPATAHAYAARAVEVLTRDDEAPGGEPARLRALKTQAELAYYWEMTTDPRAVSRHGPSREAIELMLEAASGHERRNELLDAYQAHRRIALWFMGARAYEEALGHYRDCRRVADVLITEAGRLEAEMIRVARNSLTEEGRAELISDPPPALRRVNAILQVATATAPIDCQSAAYCAAHLGMLEEAIDWVLQSRLRDVLGKRQSRRAGVDELAEVVASGDVVAAVPIVSDAGAIVVLCSGAGDLESLDLPHLRYADLQTAPRDVDDYLAARGFDLSTQSVAWMNVVPDPMDRGEEPAEPWWPDMESAALRIGRHFVGPLREYIAERVAADVRVVMLAPAMLALMPLKAAGDMATGRDEQLRHPLSIQLAFTPTLPTSRQSTANGGSKPSALVVTGTRDLAFAELEARTVAALFGNHADLLPSGSASRDLVLERMPTVDCLHFACHGHFEPDRWNRSRLVLSSDESIEMRDVVDLDLTGVRLVTLSACDTGLALTRTMQEEFLGLPRAFAMAGAAAILCTLWEVNDLSTALVLEAFYGSYLAGEHPARALREAQERIRDLSAKMLVDRARNEMAKEGNQRKWRPMECSVIIGRYGDLPDEYRPFESPYHWGSFVLWSTS